MEVSVADGLFQMTNTAHVTLRGLNLEASRGTAVRIKDRRELPGCRLLDSECDELRRHDRRRQKLRGGRVRHHRYCGGGVFMAGGDRQKLIPGGHYVENCRIHHFARWDRTYRPGILMTGVCLRASPQSDPSRATLGDRLWRAAASV